MKSVALLILLVLDGSLWAAAAHAPPPAAMRSYQSPCYIVHSDIDSDDVNEAILRMTAMAREYRALAGVDNQQPVAQVPLYLFRTRQQYLDSGGAPGSIGVFNQAKLMVLACPHADARTWHAIQHEGFHQFAATAMGGRLPVWLDEGIAEYFGESLFTGNGYVSGVIPPWRLERIRREIRDSRFMSLARIMLVGKSDWNARLKLQNYDQAWSIVQFFAHGPDQKRRRAFASLLHEMSHGALWDQAWRHNFADDRNLEQQWRTYWLNLPDNPTAALYGKAVVATLTSFVARAAAEKRPFRSFDEFIASAKAAHFEITRSANDWLPPGLLESAVTASEQTHMTCTLSYGAGCPRIVAKMDDGTRLTGCCEIRGGRVADVWVEG